MPAFDDAVLEKAKKETIERLETFEKDLLQNNRKPDEPNRAVDCMAIIGREAERQAR